MTHDEVVVFAGQLLRENEMLLNEKEDCKHKYQSEKKQVGDLKTQLQKKQAELDAKEKLYRNSTIRSSEDLIALLLRDISYSLYDHILKNVLDSLKDEVREELKQEQMNLKSLFNVFWKYHARNEEAFKESPCISPFDLNRVAYLLDILRDPGDELVHWHSEEHLAIAFERVKSFIGPLADTIDMKFVTQMFIRNNVEPVHGKYTTERRATAPQAGPVSKVCGKRKNPTEGRVRHCVASAFSPTAVKDAHGRMMYAVEHVKRQRRNGKTTPNVLKVQVYNNATSTPNTPLSNAKKSAKKKSGAKSGANDAGSHPPSGQPTRSGETGGRGAPEERPGTSSTTGSSSQQSRPAESSQGEASGEGRTSRRLEYPE